LEVAGPAPARLRVVFERNVESYQNADRPTVIDGNAYIVDTSATPVRDAASGSPASQEETDRVLDSFPDLGTRTRIDQVLPDGAMEVGEARHDLAAAILAVMHPRAWTLDRGTAVLERVEGADAVFAITIDATSRRGITLAVKGAARIRTADCRL